MLYYCNVLVKSEYIEYEYEKEYMTHKLYECEYEYFKNVLENRVLPAPGLPQCFLIITFSHFGTFKILLSLYNKTTILHL